MIRRSLRWFCVVVVLSMPGTAGWPSGTVSISGSLTSITENQYVVETPNSVYYIKKSAVTPTARFAARLFRVKLDTWGLTYGVILAGLSVIAAVAQSGSSALVWADCDYPSTESNALSRLRDRLSMPGPLGFGFSCSPSTINEQGMTCIGRLPDYPEPVAIIVPARFNPTDSQGSRYVMHLLGYIDQKPWDQTLAGNLAFFDFTRDLNVAAGANTLMVVPWTGERCSTYQEYFQGNGDRAFEQFMAELTQVTGVQAKSIALTSHSGAFPAMQTIMSQANTTPNSYAGRIDSIGLFDTTYWPASASLLQWADNPAHRVFNIYRDGSPTSGNSQSFDAAVAAVNPNIKTEPIEGEPVSYHWQTVKRHYVDALGFFGPN
jgi:hypothetical protein